MWGWGWGESLLFFTPDKILCCILLWDKRVVVGMVIKISLLCSPRASGSSYSGSETHGSYSSWEIQLVGMGSMLPSAPKEEKLHPHLSLPREAAGYLISQGLTSAGKKVAHSAAEPLP